MKRHKERTFTFIDHCWVSPDTLACVTNKSDVCIFVKGESQQTISLDTGDNPEEPDSIQCIAGYGPGFILGMASGCVKFYQTDTSHNHIFYLYKEFFTGQNSAVQYMATSPSKELLALTVNNYGVVVFPLGRLAVLSENESSFSDGLYAPRTMYP